MTLREYGADRRAELYAAAHGEKIKMVGGGGEDEDRRQRQAADPRGQNSRERRGTAGVPAQEDEAQVHPPGH